MADPALLAEAYKRGLLPSDKKSAYEEAVKRGLIPGAKEQEGDTDPKWGLPVVGDFARAFGQAKDAVVGEYDRQVSKATRPMPKSIPQFASDMASDLTDVPRMAGALMGFAGAPQAAIVRPIARAATIIPGTNAADNEKIINTALMGMKPAAGRIPELGSAPVPAFPKPEIRVASALARAAKGDEIAPQVLSASARATPKQPAFHAGGDNVVGLAEALAQSPGPGMKIVRAAVRDHQAAAPERVKGQLASAFGADGTYLDTLDAALAQRKAAAAPLRDAAFSQPIDSAAFNEKIAPVLDRVPQQAMSYAAKAAKLDGFNPTDIGFEVSPASGDIPTMVSVKQPSMQALHYVKKGLDQELEGYRNALGKLDLEGQPLAGLTSNVRSQLGRAMRDASPEYDQYMAKWGDESGHISALRLGRDVFSSSPEMSYGSLKKAMKDWSATDRDMYMKGVGEALVDRVRGARGGVGTARQLLKSEEISDRVKLALRDPSAYDGFMSAMEDEVAAQGRNNRVVGGSPTYARQAARAAMDEEGMHPLDVAGEALDVGLSPTRLAGKALKATLKAIPRKDRSLVGDPETNRLLGQAITDPNEMTRLLNLLEASKAQPLLPNAPRVGQLTAGVPQQALKPTRR